MLSQLFRSLNRNTFKCIQSQNYVKRFYSNQDFNEKTVSEDNEYSDKYYHFVNDWDETSRVYQEYYKTYYDNFKNKFDNRSGDRQTDSNNGHKSRNHKNNEKFNSNSYSFSECKYHLLTLRLLEKVGYIGAAIVVGLHFESPIYYSRQRAIIKSRESLDKPNDPDNCYNNVCGQCRYCSAILSKLRVLSAPIRKSYVFSSKSNKFLDFSNSKITEITEEKSSEQIHDESNEGIPLIINKGIEQSSDPIDDICRQLQTASIHYIDRLNNLLGIALIQTDPDEAMRCWRSSKTSPKALFNMGVAFERGLHSSDGTPDLTQAFDHYVLSASMGHKLAIYNLSLFYLFGKGGVVNVDHNRAEALLKKAAKMGVKPAENYIEKLEQKRRTQLKPTTQTMRNSASAPNLMLWSTCFESYNKENLKKYSQNLSIANRV